VPRIFEATKLSECTDIWTGTVVRGVQVVHLPERIDSFDGAVAVRKLRPALSPSLEDRLIRFAEEVHCRPFNDRPKVVVRALHRKNRSSTGPAFFCSELVAEAYQHLEVLPAPPGAGSTSSRFGIEQLPACRFQYLIRQFHTAAQKWR
jgi:hypothetical protein